MQSVGATAKPQPLRSRRDSSTGTPAVLGTRSSSAARRRRAGAVGEQRYVAAVRHAVAIVTGEEYSRASSHARVRATAWLSGVWEAMPPLIGIDARSCDP